MALRLALVRENEQTGEVEVLFDHDLKAHLLDAVEQRARRPFRKRHCARTADAYDLAEAKLAIALKARTSEIS